MTEDAIDHLGKEMSARWLSLYHTPQDETMKKARPTTAQLLQCTRQSRWCRPQPFMPRTMGCTAVFTDTRRLGFLAYQVSSITKQEGTVTREEIMKVDRNTHQEWMTLHLFAALILFETLLPVHPNTILLSNHYFIYIISMLVSDPLSTRISISRQYQCPMYTR